MSKGTTTLDRSHAHLLRQPVRRRAAPVPARGAGAQDVRGRLRGRRVRRAAAHAAGAARRRERRPSRRRPGPARTHRRRAGAAGRLNRKELTVMSVLYGVQRNGLEAAQAAARCATSTSTAPDELLIVTTDRLSAFDVILPTPHPGQGRRAHADQQLLVRQAERHHPQPHRRPRALRRRRRARAPRRPLRGRAQGASRCRSRRSCAATSPDRASRTTRRPAGSAASSCRPASWSRAGSSARCSRPSTKAAVGDHDENISLDQLNELVNPEIAERVHNVAPRALRRRRGLRARARHHHRRHQVRVRHARRPAHPHRRGAHAGLVALLAGRRLRAGQRAAELRQAVRARLPRDARLGQDGAGPGAAAGRGRRRPPRSTARRGAG